MQIALNACRMNSAIVREAEFMGRREPIQIEWVACLVQIVDHPAQILPDKVWQHETIMQFRAPVETSQSARYRFRSEVLREFFRVAIKIQRAESLCLSAIMQQANRTLFEPESMIV